MAFIRTIAEDEAAGLVRQLYEQDRSQDGYVNNTTKALSLHPEIATAWSALSKAIRSNMDPRRYELITVGAAVELRSTYCTLAHAAAAVRNFISRLFDSLGAEPDAAYLGLDERLRHVLAVGRPFGEGTR